MALVLEIAVEFEVLRDHINGYVRSKLERCQSRFKCKVVQRHYGTIAARHVLILSPMPWDCQAS
jgi:hypothetical protein